MRCKSFGQDANSTEGATGALNIDWATPMFCWVSETTVSGVAINDTGFVPDAFVEWSWDDDSLGTVPVAGLTVDLGASVGPNASHAFLPTTFSDTCNGGGGKSLHTVRATITAMVSGARVGDSVFMNVCVEDTRVTKPTTCYHDGTLGSGCPAGATDGGNIAVGGLATAIRRCETAGASMNILLKGGVTFTSPSTSLSVGSRSCLVSSYGAGRAKLHFTSASTSTWAIDADQVACAGYRLVGVTFAGSGGAPRLVGGSANTGCLALIDTDVSQVNGEELGATIQVGSSSGDMIQEFYFFKHIYNRHAGGLNANYAFCQYCAWVGGLVDSSIPNGVAFSGNSGEHQIRWPNYLRLVVDAMVFPAKIVQKTILAMRQDCGANSLPCPHNASSGQATVSRSLFNDSSGGSGQPIQVNGSGSSSNTLSLTYDVDFIRNLGRWSVANAPVSYLFLPDNPGPGSDAERFRFIQNAMDATNLDGTHRLITSNVGISDSYIAGNVIVSSGTGTHVISNIGGGTPANNVCVDLGTGACSALSGNGQIAVTVNPFISAPGFGANFDFSDTQIPLGSALIDIGVKAGYATDAYGGAIDAAGPYDSGVHEFGSSPPLPPVDPPVDPPDPPLPPLVAAGANSWSGAQALVRGACATFYFDDDDASEDLASIPVGDGELWFTSVAYGAPVSASFYLNPSESADPSAETGALRLFNAIDNNSFPSAIRVNDGYVLDPEVTDDGDGGRVTVCNFGRS
jgi:hypothetical protein